MEELCPAVLKRRLKGGRERSHTPFGNFAPAVRAASAPSAGGAGGHRGTPFHLRSCRSYPAGPSVSPAFRPGRENAPPICRQVRGVSVGAKAGPPAPQAPARGGAPSRLVS
ncbi:hypothetical protein GCM10009605_59320 [Nocardiopsis composta]